MAGETFDLVLANLPYVAEPDRSFPELYADHTAASSDAAGAAYTLGCLEQLLLKGHEPYPALAIDRRLGDGSRLLIGRDVEELDDLDTGTAIDLWDHKLASEMRVLQEIFARHLDGHPLIDRQARAEARHQHAAERDRREVVRDLFYTQRLSGQGQLVGYTAWMHLTDQPGSLAEVLSVFSRRGVSLAKIESRPIPNSPWQYRFYLDLHGNADRDPVRGALAEVRPLTAELRILGTYPETDREPAP